MKYTVKKIKEDFDITDKSKITIFETAEEFSFMENKTAKEPKQSTQFRMVYSDSCLYALYVCEDSEIVTKYNEYNQNLYEDDVCEIFISPLGIRNCYDEIEYNPTNAVFHGQIINNMNGKFQLYYKSESTIQSSTTKIANGFVTIAKIPFCEFVSKNGKAPNKKDKWLFNAFRVDKDGSNNVEIYALNPTLCETFHNPKFFIEMKFC